MKNKPFPLGDQLGLNVILPKEVCGLALDIIESEINISFAPERLERNAKFPAKKPGTPSISLTNRSHAKAMDDPLSPFCTE